MAGELIGLDFGTYSGMIHNLKKDYRIVTDPNAKLKNNQHEFKFFQKDNGRIAGNGFKGIIRYDHNSVPQYTNTVIFKGNLQYGTIANNEKDLEKFDYIIDLNGNEYAIDLNENGKIDKDEVFSGRMSQAAYLSAKRDGDLKKYNEYVNKYNYGWLK